MSKFVVKSEKFDSRNSKVIKQIGILVIVNRKYIIPQNDNNKVCIWLYLMPNRNTHVMNYQNYTNNYILLGEIERKT